MIRSPQAGGFYPTQASALEKLVNKFFDKVEMSNEYKAGVVPHAGYAYSGLAAAAFYKSLKRAGTVVILGNDHYGNALDISTHPYSEWETPLGKVPVDEDLVDQLDFLGLAKVESFKEHSIEVQLPFLQYLWGDFAFLPITVPQVHSKRLKELGEALATLRVPIIASSDLSHYVPHERATELDTLAIDALVSGKPEQLLEVVRDNAISMCGVFPATTLMHAFPKSERELVMYYTSGDVTGDKSAVVGYASIGFK